MTRHFTHHLSESVGRYINRVRIGHACRMLTDTHAPVSVIATRSGFPNVANFNRQFKALKDITPLEYRAQFANARQDDEAMSPRLTERSASLQPIKKRQRRAGAAVKPASERENPA